MRFLAIILFLFYTASCVSQQCLHYQKVHDANTVGYLDCKSRRTYPVAPSKNKIRMILVPDSSDEHAQCLTAATYRMLQDSSFDTIIFVSQSDSVAFHGIATPYINDCHSSAEFLCSLHDEQKLTRKHLFYWYDLPFDQHDSLPFHERLLQFYCKNCLIIPLMIGQISQDDARCAAEIIGKYCKQDTLIVISAQCSAYQNCVQLCPTDQSKLCAVYDADCRKVQAIGSGVDKVSTIMCDTDRYFSIFFLYEQLLVLPTFAPLQAMLVGYEAFENVSNAQVTSCTASIFYEHDALQGKRGVSWYEQQQLLQIARSSLHHFFDIPCLRKPCMISYPMTQPGGVFASLYAMTDHGVALRGCMGKVTSSLALSDMVYQMTQQAAYQDARFYPLRQKDAYSTIISLAVVTDIAKVDQFDGISQEDGIVLEYNGLTAICMPSLKPIIDWNYQAALADLSFQISSHGFAWKKPQASVFTFRSLIFQEE